MSGKLLVIIAGPTGIGKTALTIRLAQQYGTEIISCDSRQFYKELEIGTAKPDAAELAAVPHHLINSHRITEEVNAGDFAALADELAAELFKRHDIVFMTGGSGLYIKAFTDGLDEMPADRAVRERLEERLATEGLEALQAQLERLDPERYAAIDRQNPRRLVRALEVCIVSGRKMSELLSNQPEKSHDFDILHILLNMPRETLYERINRRCDAMIERGLPEEALSFYEQRHLNALKTVGYKEFFQMADGGLTRTEAIEKFKRNSRNYAKRQLTWFRGDDRYLTYAPDDYAGIRAAIEAKFVKA